MRDHQVVGRDGMLAEMHPVHGAADPALNEVFDTRNSKVTFLDLPLLSTNRRAFDAAFSNLYLVNAEANRLQYVAVYTEKLLALKQVNEYRQLNPLTNGGRRNPVVRFHPSHPYSFDQIYSAYKSFLLERLRVLKNP